MKEYLSYCIDLLVIGFKIPQLKMLCELLYEYFIFLNFPWSSVELLQIYCYIVNYNDKISQGSKSPISKSHHTTSSFVRKLSDADNRELTKQPEKKQVSLEEKEVCISQALLKVHGTYHSYKRGLENLLLLVELSKNNVLSHAPFSLSNFAIIVPVLGHIDCHVS